MTNEDGGPLQRKWIDDAARGRTRRCNIAGEVKRAIGRLGLNLSIREVAEDIRRACAYNHPTSRPRTISCSLGHSPRTVGEIYLRPAQRRDSRQRDPMVGDSVYGIK